MSRRVLTLGLLLATAGFGQKAAFESRCASCHGDDGNGGEHGPAITRRIANRTDAQLANIIHDGFPGGGMPAFNLSTEETQGLIAYLRTLHPPPGEEPVRMTTQVDGEGAVEGVVLGRSAQELQLQTSKGLYLLRKSANGYRRVTSQSDWPAYNGSLNGNRYSTLNQITSDNVARLSPQWIFPVANAGRLQGTPVVAGGVMYVTGPNECYALDAGTGRQLWHYSRPRTKNLTGNAAGGINRGVALAGNRLFLVTDNAHLLALDKLNGSLLWDIEMADWHLNYNATSAPLAVADLVISGSAGGDEGARGFIAAFNQATGKEVWRFWTVPAKGEPGSETWVGRDYEHPASAAWFTGSYDEQLGLLFWGVGNPGPDLNGDARKGDNLYSGSTVALDVRTGKLKWHYQYTPHDVWDWDATQTEVLVDTVWNGAPRKLLLHANRNGFLYILDRTNGKVLLAKPFVKKLTWAKEIGADGRPVKIPGKEPTEEGNQICPALEGATNWFSPAYHPGTGLFYFQTLEKCAIFVKRVTEWSAGKSFFGGSVRNVPGDNPQKILRAVDIQTGKVTWEAPQIGSAESWGGVLATAGNVVFFCDDGGAFAAVDAKTGKHLWSFPVNDLWKASPMTYMFDNKQYVAVAIGSTVMSFAVR